jgi:Tfp pilus assembly protein PilW
MRCALTQRLLRRISGEERGFTLVELVAAALLLTMILGAILALSVTADKVGPRDQERAFAIRDSQVGLARMTRELRQTYQIISRTSTSMTAQVHTGGITRRVVYDCNQNHPTDTGLKQCVRYTVSGGVNSASVVIVPRVISAAFTYEPVGAATPKYVRILLQVPSKGDRKTDGHKHRIVLDDGFYMRNLDNG